MRVLFDLEDERNFIDWLESVDLTYARLDHLNEVLYTNLNSYDVIVRHGIDGLGESLYVDATFNNENGRILAKLRFDLFVVPSSSPLPAYWMPRSSFEGGK